MLPYNFIRPKDDYSKPKPKPGPKPDILSSVYKREQDAGIKVFK
jgi:hypothetical protein